jgi:hypothetical protein
MIDFDSSQFEKIWQISGFVINALDNPKIRKTNEIKFI